MLELVSLTPEEAKRRVRNYSLGMRQRLGIAHALLGDPSVLILDEPANGLDPAGIRWMRGLLKGYADRGGTVLLSSHLLNEVELIADEMILIGRGRIVAQGDKKSLLRAAPTTRSLVTSLDNARARPGPASRRASTARPAGDGPAGRRRGTGRGRPGRRRARDRAHRPARPATAGLEDLFLELTSDTQRDPTVTEGAPGMTTTATAPEPLDLSATTQVPMSRLARVEFRKSLDTRAGRWFTGSIIVLCLAVVTIYAFAAPDDAKDYLDLLGIAGAVLGSFLPILIILLVTAESSQRTGLVTFTLEPQRSRVVIAKFIAGVVLGRW